ncbi:helix-turn-helix transcriptional regulator [Planococcus shixiaomingii]|uniref:helix-turn-helix transcriptional regulator n=1 Tax=Planococcus shixiaomingii TaxID=3058393 RepID=UPI00262CEBAA|nr:helix-turn-helix transcriptional regulator [Planococcus sp. N022]WKA55310.1 helix-turn-helix transcriptional regulator [Planococcus sp. N022]
MATLGERIKKLRKEKGLTLQALAGESLTKGMLSLIENNKANPSMESLSYIAEQLGVDKNELLEEVSTTEMRELLHEVESLYKIEIQDPKNKFKPIIDKIKPYEKKMPYRYESARLLEIYSHCLYHAKSERWQTFLDHAEEMYEGLHMINKTADIHTFRATVKFMEHDYAQSLKMLQESRQFFDEREAVLDSLKKLDFDYLEAVMYCAVGDADNALRIMKEAVDYAKDNKIFYRINDLYRVMSFQAVLNNDQDSRNYYVKKLRLFAEFAEDEEIYHTLDLLEAHYRNSFTHEYQKAYDIVEEFLEKKCNMDISQFSLEKGKALYGLGKLDEALHWLQDHKISEYLHHPYDLSMNYEKDAYMALIYEKQGNHNLAVKHAEIAKENIEPMPDLPYKKFILDVHKKITQ